MYIVRKITSNYFLMKIEAYMKGWLANPTVHPINVSLASILLSAFNIFYNHYYYWIFCGFSESVKLRILMKTI